MKISDYLSKPALRILVTRTDRIGDLVLSTPVFQALREKFPDAKIAALIFFEHREILEGNPYLDEVILYDKQGSEKGLWGQGRFAREIARKKFDMVIHLHATNRMHGMGRLAGIPVRIGWARRAPWALTHAIPDIKRQGREHESSYNFELLRPLGITKPKQTAPYFPVSEKAKRSFEELVRHLYLPQNRPWVVIHPFASCPSKVWHISRFAALARRLARGREVSVIMIGSEKDRPQASELNRLTGGLCHDLSGRLSLSTLGVLFKKSVLLVSNDSGPVHIAAALGTPVVSIFGRRDPGLSPERWRPLGENHQVLWHDTGCDPCLAHRCQIHFLCLDTVTVEEVMRAALRVLDRGKTGVL